MRMETIINERQGMIFKLKLVKKQYQDQDQQIGMWSILIFATYSDPQILRSPKIFRVDLIYQINEWIQSLIITIMSVNLYFSQSTSFLIQSMQKQIYPKRVFGQSLRQNQLKTQQDAQVDLKPRGRKHPCTTPQTTQYSIHPQMNYLNQITAYCLGQINKTVVEEPQSKKIKKDIEAMLSNDHYHIDTNNNGIFTQLETQGLKSKTQKKYFFSEQIDFDTRFTLVDWMITLHRKFKLRQQTLHIAVDLVDRFAKRFPIKLAEYQLLGVSALFLAGKYEEVTTPILKYFVSVCDKLYTKDQLLSMESQILIKCNFSISQNISTYWFLNMFGIKTIVFGESIFKGKTKKNSHQNKQNLNYQNSQRNDDIHQKFLKKCTYVLNLVLLEFNLRDQENDLISISVLIFVSMQKQFASADSHKIFNNYFQYKQAGTKLTKAELKKKIKVCNDKIQKLYQSRFQNKFFSLNQKFGIQVQT